MTDWTVQSVLFCQAIIGSLLRENTPKSGPEPEIGHRHAKIRSLLLDNVVFSDEGRSQKSYE